MLFLHILGHNVIYVIGVMSFWKCGATDAAPHTVIHAPTRGATGTVSVDEVAVSVSIHAPTRGATFGQFGKRLNPAVSIHAPTRGATGELIEGTVITLFQSTPLHEGRLSNCILLKYSHIYIVFRESHYLRSSYVYEKCLIFCNSLI